MSHYVRMDKQIDDILEVFKAKGECHAVYYERVPPSEMHTIKDLDMISFGVYATGDIDYETSNGAKTQITQTVGVAYAREVTPDIDIDKILVDIMVALSKIAGVTVQKAQKYDPTLYDGDRFGGRTRDIVEVMITVMRRVTVVDCG